MSNAACLSRRLTPSGCIVAGTQLGAHREGDQDQDDQALRQGRRRGPGGLRVHRDAQGTPGERSLDRVNIALARGGARPMRRSGQRTGDPASEWPATLLLVLSVLAAAGLPGCGVPEKKACPEGQTCWRCTIQPTHCHMAYIA